MRRAWGWVLALACAAAQAADPGEFSPERLRALALEAGLDEARAPAARDQLMAELAMRDILAEKAKAAGLHNDPQVAAAMELASASALGQAYLRSRETEPDPKQIEADWRSAYPPKEQAKVRLAMFKDKALAARGLSGLRSGKPMKEVALASDDPALAGQEAQWIALDALPEQLAKALEPAGAARFPSEPVKTPYGWAIYDLEGRKVAPQKTFEQAKGDLIQRRRELARRVELSKLRQEAQSRLPKTP